MREIETLDIEPRLASWDAISHPSHQRLQTYLDKVEQAFAGHLGAQDARFYLHVEVVRPARTDLLRDHDLENYLTPIAQRLRSPAVVLATAVKRHPTKPADRSRVTLGRVTRAARFKGWNFCAANVTGSPDSGSWKAALRQQPIDARARPAAAGPLNMVIALRCDPSRRRAWWNIWKQAGDALGPILGEPRRAAPFHPADDRVVRLEMHYSPKRDLHGETQLGIWWQEATID